MRLPVLTAAECPACPECGEPWCVVCRMHYAECRHPGPHGDLACDAAGDVETAGLGIDMLDADRLRQWAENIDTYGADLTHWSDPKFVSAKLRDLAGSVEQAVRDIGRLRAALNQQHQLKRTP